ncbi:MAG TPA: hypothetical protein VH722_20880 [Alphaproteobacteria bacterium]|jgi:hypothetical protein|nr:hypothetical protein [Alphaproteobacteria bacterium]
MNKVTAGWSIACLCLAGSALAEGHVIRWAKAGATYENYLSDRSACLAAANAAAGTSPRFRGGIVRSAQVFSNDAMASCMVGRGYVRDPNGFLPPDGGVRMQGGAVVPYQSNTN